jgi:hypothetical protein
MFIASAKIIKNNLKGAKMTYNRSNAWAIVHAFCPEMTPNACFIHEGK